MKRNYKKEKVTVDRLKQPDFNTVNLDKDFNFFKINCLKKWPPKNLFQKINEEDPGILSLYYCGTVEQTIYVLHKKDDMTAYKLHIIAQKLSQYVGQVQALKAGYFASEFAYVLLNLLLNRLIDFKAIPGCELLGRLYLTQDLDKQMKSQKNQQLGILEAGFNSKLEFHIYSRAVTQLKSYIANDKENELKNRKNNKICKLFYKPRFELNKKTQRLVQVASCYTDDEEDHPNWFIMASLYKNAKPNSMQFMKVSQKRKNVYKTFINQSKAGRLYKLLQELNRQYQDKYFNEPLAFATQKTNSVINKDASSRLQNFRKAEQEFYSQVPVTIVNKTEYPEFADDIKAVLTDPEHIGFTLDNFDPNGLPIILIHEPKQYAGKTDAYVAGYNQHLTYEAWPKIDEDDSKFVKNKKQQEQNQIVNNILDNLMTKYVVEYQDASPLLVEPTNLQFYKYYPNAKTVLQFLPQENSKFEINEIDTADANNPFLMLSEPFDPDKETPYECLVKEEDNIFGIKNTSLITMPNKEMVADMRKAALTDPEDNYRYRSLEQLHKYQSGTTDIHYWEKGNNICYTSGIIRRGMHQPNSKATHVRLVESINSDNSLNNVFNLIQMLDVIWVKYGQLTVLPYPIKLLNEYYRSNLKHKNND